MRFRMAMLVPLLLLTIGCGSQITGRWEKVTTMSPELTGDVEEVSTEVIDFKPDGTVELLSFAFTRGSESGSRKFSEGEGSYGKWEETSEGVLLSVGTSSVVLKLSDDGQTMREAIVPDPKLNSEEWMTVVYRRLGD